MNKNTLLTSFAEELLALCKKHKVNMTNSSFEMAQETFAIDVCGQWDCFNGPPVSIYKDTSSHVMDLEDPKFRKPVTETEDPEEVSLTDMPVIQVVSCEEQENGTLNCVFKTNDAYDAMVAESLSVDVKDLTPEQVSKHINELLTKASEEQDGYSFSTTKI